MLAVRAQWKDSGSGSVVPEEWKKTVSGMLLVTPAGTRRQLSSSKMFREDAVHPELRRSTVGGPKHVRMVLSPEYASV